MFDFGFRSRVVSSLSILEMREHFQWNIFTRRNYRWMHGLELMGRYDDRRMASCQLAMSRDRSSSSQMASARGEGRKIKTGGLRVRHGGVGLFWRRPKKSPVLGGGQESRKHRQGRVRDTQVELRAELGEIALAGQEGGHELSAEFFGARPKKLAPFLAPPKNQKSRRVGDEGRGAGAIEISFLPWSVKRHCTGEPRPLASGTPMATGPPGVGGKKSPSPTSAPPTPRPASPIPRPVRGFDWTRFEGVVKIGDSKIGTGRNGSLPIPGYSDRQFAVAVRRQAQQVSWSKPGREIGHDGNGLNAERGQLPF